MSGRKKAITGALTRRRAAAGGAAALVLSPFIIRTGFAQRATINIGVIQPLSGANAQSGVNCRNGIELAADEVSEAILLAHHRTTARQPARQPATRRPAHGSPISPAAPAPRPRARK